MVSDASGARKYSELMGQFAYHLPTLEGGINLSAGLNFGLHMNGFDFGDMYAANMNDDWITTPFQHAAFNMGFGFLANVDRVFISFALPHVLEYDLGTASPVGRRLRHQYWSTGYTHPVNSVLDLRICGLVKSVADAPATVDVNFEMWIQETLSLGMMMRFNEGMGIQGSYRFKDGWRIHYGVDFPLNGLMQRSFGSHELGLAWDFGKRSIAYVNPRYF
jgi:type IX secretion system PorP/SprF family membrane protein